ncbi:hypothetical protein BDR04DRAFT_1112364 [Suillus decipiens]|nr:hypothetical protein BDR04DRAFT_1112364 [Suillus decipiens]
MSAVPPDCKTSHSCSRSGEQKVTLADATFLRGGDDGTLTISWQNCHLTGTSDGASDGASSNGTSADETLSAHKASPQINLNVCGMKEEICMGRIFDLVPPMLGDFIEHCYDTMGCPTVTRSTVWTVYRNVLSAVQSAENPHPDLLLTEDGDAAAGTLSLIDGQADLPFNEELDGTYYMGGMHRGLGLDSLAELDEPNVPLGDGPIENQMGDHTALVVWQFSSDKSENDGMMDECLRGMSGVLSKVFTLLGSASFHTQVHLSTLVHAILQNPYISFHGQLIGAGGWFCAYKTCSKSQITT